MIGWPSNISPSQNDHLLVPTYTFAPPLSAGHLLLLLLSLQLPPLKTAFPLTTVLPVGN